MKSLILLTIICSFTSIALAAEKPALTYYDVVFGKTEDANFCVVFTNDTKYIVAGDQGGIVNLYNLEQERIVHKFGTKDYHAVVALRVTPNSRYIVTLNNHSLMTVWDLELRELHFKVDTSNLQGSNVTNLAVTPDNQFIIATSLNKWIYVFSFQTKALVKAKQSLELTKDPQIQITADNKYLITSVANAGIKVQLLNGLTEVHTLRDTNSSSMLNNEVRSLVLTSDSKFAITGQDDKAIRIWNIASGELVRIINEAHNDVITGLALTSDNKFLFSMTKNNLRIWNFETKELVHNQNSSNIYSFFKQVAVSPINDRVAVAASDRNLTLYNLNVYSRTQRTALSLEELEELENELDTLYELMF